MDECDSQVYTFEYILPTLPLNSLLVATRGVWRGVEFLTVNSSVGVDVAGLTNARITHCTYSVYLYLYARLRCHARCRYGSQHQARRVLR